MRTQKTIISHPSTKALMMAMASILIVVLAEPPTTFAAGKSTYQSKHPRDIRIMLQDIGDQFTRMPWPPTPEGLLSASIDPIKDTAIDVYACGMHHAGGCTHDSKIYQVVGDNIEVLHESAGLKMNEGVKRFIEQGYDPITIMCDGAHAAGKDFWLRMRMNDLHDQVGRRNDVESWTKAPKSGFLEPYYYTPKWKRDHPEWLIGELKGGSYDFETFEAGAPNYIYAPVRKMMLDFASEAIQKYDIDGFEIDFIRFPYFFDHDRAWASRHIMTEFVRRLRRVIDEQSKRRGRPIYFSARVPDTIELALRTGLDIRTWFEEGLLDMCVISGGYAPFSTPWRDIVSLGEKYNIPVKACISNSKMSSWQWKRTEQGLQPEPSVQQKMEHVRAAACRAYQQGVTGFELWNYFYEYPQYYSPEQKEGVHYLGYGFTKDISDKDSLAHMKKAYLLDTSLGLGSLYDHVSWAGQRPIMIAPADDGIGQTVTFDVGDDLNTFPNATARLWINIVDFFVEDVVEFEWNGKPLTVLDTGYIGHVVYSNNEFQFDIPADQIKQGVNTFTILLKKRTPRLEPYITLDFARLSIDPGAK